MKNPVAQKRIPSLKRALSLNNALDSDLTSELFQQFVEEAADGIFILKFSGQIEYANHAATSILGTSMNSLKGKPFRKFLSKNDSRRALDYFRKVRQGNQVIRDELEVVNKKGEVVPIEFTASPITFEGRIVKVYAIIRDISERKTLESVLRLSDKEQVLQQFILGMTQEIQHPLQGVYEHSKNLLETYQDRDFEYIGFNEFKGIMEGLESLRDQVQYCNDTVERLVKLNRKNAGLDGQKCDANQAVRSAMKHVNHLFEVSEIKLTVKLASRLPNVKMGAIELTEVLIKIITNAAQAITEKGVVEIKTTHVKKDKAVRIDCYDDGIGIPKDVLPRIFEPFFTMKQRGLEKCSGLGLAIVYSMVKSYGGEISVSSNQRKGTRVTIILPTVTSKK